MYPCPLLGVQIIGGGGEIRTHERCKPLEVFKTSALGLYATPPSLRYYQNRQVMYNVLMRYLGIDFGSKRVGLALSDEEGRLAFPYVVLKNDRTLLSEVERVCKEQKVRALVIGESKDFNGKDNPIAKKIAEFKTAIEKLTRKRAEYEPEFLTSVQAARWQGKTDKLDASAAAIILQSYLDRRGNVL
jgi:putative holliday junction resolvase